MIKIETKIKYVYLVLAMSLFILVGNRTQAESLDGIGTEEYKEEISVGGLTRGIQPYANTSLKNFPSVSFDYETPLDSKYSFFPRLNTNSKWLYEDTREEITSFDTGKTKNSTGKSVINFNSTTVPGTLRVTNVGVYNGIKLDLLITVTAINKKDYTSIFNPDIKSFIELGVEASNFLNIYASGDTGTAIDLKFTTVESLDGDNEKPVKEIKTSGVITYNNITKYKKLLLQKDQVSKIYTPQDTIVNYDPNSKSTINGHQPVYTFESNIGDDTAQNRMVHMYEDLSSRSVGIQLRERNIGVVQVLSANPPLIVTPPVPLITGNTEIAKGTEKGFFKIQQVIPPQPSKKFDGFKIILAVKNVIEDINLNDVIITDQSNIEIKENSITKRTFKDDLGIQYLEMVATEEYLNSNLSNGIGLYGNRLDILVPIKLDYNSNYDSFIDETGQYINVYGELATVIPNFNTTFYPEKNTPALFTNKANTILKTQNQNGDEILPKQITSNVINKSYDLSNGINYLSSHGFELLNIDGESKGIQTPADINVVANYQDKRFENSLNIYTDGEKITKNEVAYNQDITVELSSHYIAKDQLFEANFSDSNISSLFPKKLFVEAPQNLRIVNKDENIIGQVSYDEQTNLIIAKLDPEIDIKEDWFLKYEGTISKEIPLGALENISFNINIKDNVFSCYFDNKISQKITVKDSGNVNILIPDSISFESLPIWSKDVSAAVSKVNGFGIIYDTTTSSNWNIKMRLDDSGFVGEKSKYHSNLGLIYRDTNGEIPISQNDSTVIFSSEQFEKNKEYYFEELLKSYGNNGLRVEGNTFGDSTDKYHTQLIWELSLSQY